MKFYILLPIICCALSLSAQKSHPSSDEHFAIIKGHISNNKDTTWDYSRQGYLSNEGATVHIDKNGNFLERIKTETETEGVGLFLDNDCIELGFIKNDTVELDWDAHDLRNSIVIKSNDPVREKELQTQLLLFRHYRSPAMALYQTLYTGGLSDSAKFVRVNDLYNQEMTALLEQGVTPHTENMVINLYFQYTSMLQSQQLLPRYELTLLHPSSNSDKIHFLRPDAFGRFKPYQMEMEGAFRNCSYYRDFVYNYIRFLTPLLTWSVSDTSAEEMKDPVLDFDPARRDYYTGLRSFRIKEVREWFISKCIIDGFYFYPYEKVDTVYQKFMSTSPSPFYAKALKASYAKAQKLKPGALAPVFTLRDETGKNVSLTDFRGKVVFIDFWGVHCGPCIGDIKEHVPELHERYKDKNVVFINICIDGPEDEWRKDLTSLHINGVNFLAGDNWNTPVCKAYSLMAIPHYYLIDQNGKIVDNNCHFWQMDALYAQLDKLLR